MKYGIDLIVRNIESGEFFNLKPNVFFPDLLNARVVCNHMNNLLDYFEKPSRYYIKFVVSEFKN